MAVRRRRSHSRRKRRVIWWAPPTTPLGATTPMNDPTVSCFADVGVGFFPVGSMGSPTFGLSPIITNLKPQISPDELKYPEFSQHPSTERWRVERIVGDVAVQAIGTAQPSLFLDGIDIHMGIVRRTATHDAVSMVFPDANDECLADWLWMTHFSMSAASTVCHECPIEWDGTGDASGSGALGTAGHVVTPYEVFGTPALTWTHVDVRVKRNVRTEDGIWLVVRATVGAGAEDRVALSWQPKLRALLSRSV